RACLRAGLRTGRDRSGVGGRRLQSSARLARPRLCRRNGLHAAARRGAGASELGAAGGAQRGDGWYELLRDRIGERETGRGVWTGAGWGVGGWSLGRVAR